MDAGHDDSKGNAELVSRFRPEEPTFQHKRRVSPSPPRYATREPNLPIRKKTQLLHHQDDREDFIILGDQSKFRLNMIPYRVRSHSAPRYSDSTDMLTWLANDEDYVEDVRHHPGDYYNAYSLRHHGDGRSGGVRGAASHEAASNADDNDVVNNTINPKIDDDSASDVSDRNAREAANVKILPSKSIKNFQLQTKNSAKQKSNKAAFPDGRSQKGVFSNAKVVRNPVHIGAKPSGFGHFSRGSLNRSRNVTASKSNSGTVSTLKAKDKNQHKSGELLSKSDVEKFLADRHREKIKSDKTRAKQKDDARKILSENETHNRGNQKAAPTVHYKENETRKKSDESLGEMIVNRSNENRNNTAGGHMAVDHRDPNDGPHRKSRSENRRRQRTMSEYQNEFQWAGNRNESAVIRDFSTPLQKNSLNKSLPTLSWLSFNKEPPRDLHSEYQDQFRPKSAVDFRSRDQSSSPSRPHHRRHHYHHHHNVLGQRYYDDADVDDTNGNPMKNASSLKTGVNYGKTVQRANGDGIGVKDDDTKEMKVGDPSHNGDAKADDPDENGDVNVNNLMLTDNMNDSSINQNSHKELFHGRHHRNRSEYEVKFVSPSEYRLVDGIWKKAGGHHDEDFHLNRPILRDVFKSEYAREYVDKSKDLSAVINDNTLFSRRGRFDFYNSRNVNNSIKGDSMIGQRSDGLIQWFPYNEAANDPRSELKSNYNNHSRNVLDNLDDAGNSFNKPDNNFNDVESKFNSTGSNQNNVTNTFVNSAASPKPLGRDWFDHILELRRKADEYRLRGFGTTFSRDHLAQLRSDNLHFWDASSSDESSEQQYERRLAENGRNKTEEKSFYSSNNGEALHRHSHLHRQGNNKSKQTSRSHANAEDNDFSDGENPPEFNAHNKSLGRMRSQGGELNYPSVKSANTTGNSSSHKVDFAPKAGYLSDVSNLSDSLSSSLSLAEEVLERAKSRKKRLLSTK